MAKPKSDADILAMFDEISAAAKKARPGSRERLAKTPRFDGDTGEWSEVAMSNIFAAELEERQKWQVTGMVLLRERQICSCGSVHVNNEGLYVREVFKRNNATFHLRRPLPEERDLLEVLERHVEWMQDSHVSLCDRCLDWGERRVQLSFPFEGQKPIPDEVQSVADLYVAELLARPPAEPHHYFTEATANRPDADEESDDEEVDEETPTDVLDFMKNLTPDG